MEMNQPSSRLHPLLAGAAVSVMLVSLLGIAALSGLLPNSHGSATETARLAAQPAPLAAQQLAAAPAVTREVATDNTVVHHRSVPHQAAARHRSGSTAYQPAAPVARNSPVGIGVGALIGGVLGSQVGGGNGRTLATIAGAIGGGYVGNEIAKRNQ